MHFQPLALTLALGLTVQAAPTTTEAELCGPNSNCHSVIENGIRVYRFKEGQEPGTESFAKRAASLRKRDEGEKKTKVTIGDTKIDCGCEASITPNYDGLWELCSEDAGMCDEGSETSREVESDAGPGLKSTAEIKLTASGTYQSKEERDHLVHAIKATVTEDTIDQDEREWSGNDGLSPGLQQGSCLMNRFPNFIGVSVFAEDGGLDSMMTATLENEGSDTGACEVLTSAGTVAGLISDIAAPFFGIVELACASEEEEDE